MDLVRVILYWIIVSAVMRSCESDPHGSHLYNEDNLTICTYLRSNPKEYSKFTRLLDEGEMLTTLCGYNPYGEGYTLFLPTNEAIDHFIEQNQEYGNFEELLLDTGFIYALARYHTINSKVHTNEFPDGALTDRTLTGDRLAIGFSSDGDNPLIKVNHVAPIIKSNLEMTNGYVHVISKVLQQVEISGYDWLQQQADYSILAKAMEISGIKERLWFDKYTIFAEHDSIYHRNGIMNIADLINRIASSEIPYSDRSNSFYQFTAYHILYGEFYLNDFYLGYEEYRTLGNESVMIDVGLDMRINPGVDTFGITISESGDTTVIDYIRLNWEDYNVMTFTGPVHSISDLLLDEPLPEEDILID